MRMFSACCTLISATYLCTAGGTITWMATSLSASAGFSMATPTVHLLISLGNSFLPYLMILGRRAKPKGLTSRTPTLRGRVRWAGAGQVCCWTSHLIMA